jgi:Flp pilus assembly secretin CpaC
MVPKGVRIGIVAWLVAICAQAQDLPQQVNVSAKIIEFQTTNSLETGFSAYFRRRNKERAFGRVTSGNGAIVNADITFPTDSTGGITVFLDRLRLSEGDLEVVLQALVDENRASILSRPKALVTVGSPVETVIQTTQAIPYEDTQVVGSSTVQITNFRDTGVTLKITCPQVIDDDGNPNTTEDTYIQLQVYAEVMEEGQRIIIALDDLSTGGFWQEAKNSLAVPEFISRSLKTSVWVRHGQVLSLGGLYRNSEAKTIATLPWLVKGEESLAGAVEGLKLPSNPISAGIGNRATNKNRRELIFLIKAELWRPAFTVSQDYGLSDTTKEENKPFSPADVIKQVVEDISNIPRGNAEKAGGESSSDATAAPAGEGK